jgi:AcrR family transcriptional regulator
MQTFIDAARRAQIIQCAIEAIAEQGYMQASVVQIARRAGISRGVISYRYPGKDDLIYDVVTEIYAIAARIMLPAIDAEPTAAGKLSAYIRSNADFIDRHRQHSLALFDIWTSFRTAEGERLDQVLVKHEVPADLVRLDPQWILHEGQQNGEFCDFAVDAVALALRQSIDGAVLRLSLNPEFDVIGYGAELVPLFERATRRA